MARFERAIGKTFEHEGFISNHRDDSGGLTKWGISQAAYPDLDIAGLTLAEARAIYQRDYWRPLRLDALNDQELANEVFDMAVNAGRKTAVLLAQKAFNFFTRATIIEDGDMGPKTIGALNAATTAEHRRDLVQAYRGFRFCHYSALVRHNPRFASFSRGWLRRAFAA
jgi:lysozyme family protein